MTDRSGRIDRSKPGIARVHDYLLGGEDDYPVDREAAAAGAPTRRSPDCSATSNPSNRGWRRARCGVRTRIPATASRGRATLSVWERLISCGPARKAPVTA
ncbi:SAM-dependent methyltransferase [Kitasatospora sp. NPDC056651]|uniref:SAM-dependent methyltransferase n=1 Tax=Kitasatospora sp. NPDC056651 TaxID=3345892 RepID=UPI0036C3341C